MRKVVVLPVVALVAVLALASPAAAHNKFRCESTVTGVTVDNVVVPRDASCILVDSTVNGNVSVGKNAFFQATNTAIAGKSGPIALWASSSTAARAWAAACARMTPLRCSSSTRP